MRESNHSAQDWLQAISTIELPNPVRILNVCGGHERTIATAGIRSVLPSNVGIIPGPGCPVCVCPEEDIFSAIALARQANVILVAFGDMLRVPCNAPKSEPRSLEQARGLGADIRPIGSPLEARKIAQDNPGKQLVFFAAGFETTAAPIAALLAEGVPNNFSILLSAKLTWPIVNMLLESEEVGFEGLIAPGHVSAVMGAEEWSFVPNTFGIPTSIGGFSTEGFLGALYAVLLQIGRGETKLDNAYPEVVRLQGNPSARAILEQIFQVSDSTWRGIGEVPASGFTLRPEFAELDARNRFSIEADIWRKRSGEMPPGCDCARVVLGKIYPDQCRLYGTVCTPRNPVGPCMVSDEGACRIWWSSGNRERREIPSESH